jgi:hypothetical protein
MAQSLSWAADSFSANKKSLLVWNPEGLLPCSQEPAAGSYPEPVEFRPHVIFFFICILILSANLT